MRADADPWPEGLDDVVPGVWYQLDWGFNECGQNFWLPGQSPNHPGELIFFLSQYNDLAAFVGISLVSGVGRINEDGDLEYTVDGIDRLLTWSPRPTSELDVYDLECEDLNE